MGFRAVQWAIQQEELTAMMQWVLVRLAWSVLDDTGTLDRSPEWLAKKCRLSLRSCRRHVLELEKLGLVCRCRSGYALPLERPPVAASGQNRQFEWPPVAIPPDPPIRKDFKEEETRAREDEEIDQAYREAVGRYFQREAKR